LKIDHIREFISHPQYQKNNSGFPSFISPKQNSFNSKLILLSFSNSKANQMNQYSQGIPSLPFMDYNGIQPRKLQHSKSQNHYSIQIPSFSNLDQNKLESHLDKQNKVLNQIYGMLARQEQLDKQKHKTEMTQRIKELEHDRLVIHQELERQKSTRIQALVEPKRPDKSEEKTAVKNDNTGMKQILYDMILNRNIKRKQTHENNLENDFSVALKHSYSESKAYNQINSNDHERIRPPSNSNVFVKRSRTKTELPTRVFRLESSNRTRNEYTPDSDLSIQEDTSIQLDLKPLRMRTTESLNLDSFQASHNSIEEDTKKSSRPPRIKKQKTKRSKTKSLKSLKNAILEEEDYEAASATLKEHKKKKARYRLMSISWLLLYGKLLYQAKKKTTIFNRNKFDSTVSSTLAQIHQIFQDYIVQAAGQEIFTMLTETKQNYIFTDPFAKQKKSEQKSTALLTHLSFIFNKLIMQISLLPNKVFDLLKLFTTENAFLPNDYFTAFELSRIKFGGFGTVRDMHSGGIKLIIGGIFLARIFLHSIIMHPWNHLNQPKTKFKIEQILNVGSILYHVIMIVLKSSVPAYQNNQSFLSFDLKVRPKKKLLQALDDPLSEKGFQIEKDQSKDGDIIEGFYTKLQLRPFFEDTKPKFEELKSLVSGCLDFLYERITVSSAY